MAGCSFLSQCYLARNCQAPPAPSQCLFMQEGWIGPGICSGHCEDLDLCCVDFCSQRFGRTMRATTLMGRTNPVSWILLILRWVLQFRQDQTQLWVKEFVKIEFIGHWCKGAAWFARSSPLLWASSTHFRYWTQPTQWEAASQFSLS